MAYAVFKNKSTRKNNTLILFKKDFASRCSNMPQGSRAKDNARRHKKVQVWIYFKGYRSISMSWRIWGILNSVGLQSYRLLRRCHFNRTTLRHNQSEYANVQICFERLKIKRKACTWCSRVVPVLGREIKTVPTEQLLFYYLDAKAVRITAGRKPTSIYRDNFRVMNLTEVHP